MRRKSKINMVLGIFFTILILSSCITFGEANTDDFNYEFSFDLEEFKEKIQTSPDECWKKPAQNRKNTICNKINKLQQLIDEENFEDAYNKLLHDIKPKLTGLKTDENEEPWGNGVFKQAWVIYENLQEEFRVECNLILSEINPSSVYDNDKTPPDISIIYEGGYYVSNPGIWHVDIEDLESGLDEVIIEVNGIVEIHDTNLLGVLSLSYDIPVPAIVGFNTIVVTATNDDKDFVGDQETSTEDEWVEIKEITSPIITIGYVGGNIDTDPGVWNVDIEDPEEGIIYVKISIDTILYIEELPGGVPSVLYPNILVPSVADDHIIEVIARNSDNYQNEDSGVISIIDDDTTGPIITVYYIGSGTTFDSGWWYIHIKDLESGLDEVLIEINGFTWLHDTSLGGIPSIVYNYIWVPGTIGTSKLEVWAWNNDTDWEDDQESSYYMTTQTIVEDPNWDDDGTPPLITINYVGGNTEEDPGVWEVTVGDAQSGIDTVTILVDGGQWIQESLGGLITKTYSVPVPGVEGFHTIEVTAVDNDNDRPNDQLSKTETSSVELTTDDTAPSINIWYEGSNDNYNPGVWKVHITDDESGIGDVQILVDGNLDVSENLLGLESKLYEVSVPSVIGSHTIEVTATNDDSTPDTSSGSMTVEIDEFIPPEPLPIDDDTAPIINIYYLGGNDNCDPGIWKVQIIDVESGIGDVRILVDGNIVLEENLQGLNSIIYDISVPGATGYHTIEVTATNDDSTPDTSSGSRTVVIRESPLPEPL